MVLPYGTQSQLRIFTGNPPRFDRRCRYLDNGVFLRMFNVTLPWDDPSNRLLGYPERYEYIMPRYPGNVLSSRLDNEIREGEYYSTHVSKVDNVRADRHEE
jgi:hypothetical protein